MALFSFTGILSRKLSNLGIRAEREARELSESIARSNFDVNSSEPQTKLRNFSKVLNELEFVRTELILAGERRQRRTMYVKSNLRRIYILYKLFQLCWKLRSKAEIEAVEKRMRDGSAEEEFTHFIGALPRLKMPDLPEVIHFTLDFMKQFSNKEWKWLLQKAGDLVDDPALDVEYCQSAGKAVVELLACKAKSQTNQ